MYDEGFAFYRNGEKLKAIELFEKIYAYDSSETYAQKGRQVIDAYQLNELNALSLHILSGRF